MTSAINGATDLYLILGDPVDQVRAPEAFNALFERLGLNAVLVPARVAAPDLPAFLRTIFQARNVKGLWVTIPHKEAAFACLPHTTQLARAAGAVNAVRRRTDGELEGALFDGEGFVQSLGQFGVDPAGRRVLVLGAGGAAAAIGASLADAPRPPARIEFYDPAQGKARSLAHRLQAMAPGRVFAVGSNDPSRFDLVVNASPLGLKCGDPHPCDVGRMESHAVFVDILMKNQPTPALCAARARGLVAEPGFEMMVCQARLYLEFFGLGEAAAALDTHTDFIRERIYPAELAHEWKQYPQAMKETAL